MMRQFIVLASLLIVWACAGCASNAPAADADEQSRGRTSDGALLKLYSDRSGPIWEDWEPTPEARVVPEGLGKTARAFDYWRVVDQATIEEVWGAVFPVVDSVRAEAPDGDRRKTLDLMLEAIEPDAGEATTGMDLTFLVSEEAGTPFEGFACRLYRRLDSGATPVLTVLMLRRSEHAEVPDRIIVWAAPGFRETPEMTAYFRQGDREGSGWRRQVSEGLDFPDGADAAAADDEAGALAAELLTDNIWKKFAGRAYLESNLSREVDRPDRIAGPDAALGLEVTRREVEQVYSDTEFPPRAEFDDLR